MPVPSRGSSTVRAEHLEQQVRAVARIDQQQFAGVRRRIHGRPRQRRGEQHVVQLDGAAAALALFFGRGEQLFGARVGDDQPPLGVGQQNRIGHRVDDREEQRPLAAQLAQLLGEAAAAADLLHLLAEDADDPGDVAGVLGRAGAQQQQPQRLFLGARAPRAGWR